MLAQTVTVLAVGASVCVLTIGVVNPITTGQNRREPLEEIKSAARQLAAEPPDDCRMESVSSGLNIIGSVCGPGIFQDDGCLTLIRPGRRVSVGGAKMLFEEHL